jgi:hypothetical protein
MTRQIWVVAGAGLNDNRRGDQPTNNFDGLDRST